MALAARLVCQRAGKVGLANTVRPAQQHVLVLGDPAARHQAGEHGAIEAARVAEVDVLERGRLPQFGAFEARAVLGRFALGHLGVNEQTEALLERQLADLGVIVLLGQRPGHAGQAHLLELVVGGMIQHGDVFQW